MYNLNKKMGGEGLGREVSVRDGEDGFEPNIEDIVLFKTIIKKRRGIGGQGGGEYEPITEDIVQLKKGGSERGSGRGLGREAGGGWRI